MTDHESPEPGAGPGQDSGYRQVWWAVLRVLAVIAVLVTIYYRLPLDRFSAAGAVIALVIGLVAFTALGVYHVRSIIASPVPGLRAVEALGSTIPFVVLLFASTYFVMARLSASSFGAPLTRTDAMYFAVTVFSTVGFGDISAKSEAARLVVTGQMTVDLVIVGLGVRIITGAITRAHQRRPQPRATDTTQPRK